MKYNVTSNLTLDLSVNTDFGQVEADDQLVNLTRFPLFFPEKRQFFQERAGTFQFNTGGADRLFHSRRIGLPQGARIPILDLHHEVNGAVWWLLVDLLRNVHRNLRYP